MEIHNLPHGNYLTFELVEGDLIISHDKDGGFLTADYHGRGKLHSMDIKDLEAKIEGNQIDVVKCFTIKIECNDTEITCQLYVRT